MIKKITKKQKDDIELLFREFLEKNNYVVGRERSSHNYEYQILKAGQEQSSIIANKHPKEFLDEQSFTVVSETTIKRFFEFIVELSNHKETQDLGYWLLINKEPNLMSYNFDKYFEVFMNNLKYNEKFIYQYFNRPKISFGKLGNLEKLFENNNIVNQEFRENIIGNLINSPIYQKQKTLDSQKNIYQLVEKYIINKDKYKEEFSNLIVEEDLGSFIRKKEKLDLLVFKIYEDDLNKVSLNRNYDLSAVKGYLGNIFSNLTQNKNTLNVMDIQIERAKEKIDEEIKDIWILDIKGINLNEEKIEVFINFILKDILSKENLKFTYRDSDIITMYVKENLIKTNAYCLEKELSEEKTTRPSMKKI